MSNGRNVAALLAAAGLGLAVRELVRRGREADLLGQVVAITGGSRGLGLALAREFTEQGAALALCARDEDELANAARGLAESGARVFAHACDITDPAQVHAFVAAVTGHYGRIDILVNNAGIITVGPVQNMTRADFEKAMATDFWGVLDPILAVLPQMRERRSGRIVNITSIGGKVSVPHLLPYVAAKFAATGLSEGLRAELARDGITVTTIVPGLLRTGSHIQAEFKGDAEKEYAWFSLSDTLPGLSISAERAAREIVRAVRRGEPERILSLPANIAARFQGLFPGLTASLLALDNRVMPGPTSDSGVVKGQVARTRLHSPLLEALTSLGRAAGERLNQRPDAPAGTAP